MTMNNLKCGFYMLPPAVQRSLGWRIRAIQSPLLTIKQRVSSGTYNSLKMANKRDWIFRRVKAIVVFAQNNNIFYRDYYKEKKFDSRSLMNYDDLSSIPIVDKDLLRHAGDRWNPESSRGYHQNTGGTSGNPLRFSIDREDLIKENIFIEKIWSELDCSYRNTRLVFGGLSHLGEKSWIYHPECDAFLINTYLPMESMKADLLRLFSEQQIDFLHGYPSAIYQFSKFWVRSAHR